ncbi:MAG: molybdopterin-dependent oxidoreductase [Geminicoccaceae bacterium]
MLTQISEKMTQIKDQYGPQALLDQSYAGASYGVLHKSDQIEGLLGRFLGMFGCRTSSWSVPSYQGTTFSSRITFGTIEDGNEDDAFAHSKLIIMWGWNPAYTFHGGNTFYYMRLAKQRGCKFVCIDPQYTDSAACYDAWWIPIRPNTDAAMMAGMAHYIFANNLHDQEFIDRFVQGMDPGTMPGWAHGRESFRDYIFGTYDGQPKTPEWASEICGVAASDIIKLADMYARTKPAALKASWAPGRNAYGEQYNRMAAALQAMTGNIGKLGGCAEGVGKGWHVEAVAYPYDQYANIWYASIKSDRWAHCVLNYPNVRREEVGLAAQRRVRRRGAEHSRHFLAGSDWFNQLTNINKEIEAIRKLDLVVCMDLTITRPRGSGPIISCLSPPISNGTTSHCPGTRGTTTSTGRWSSSPWARAGRTSRSSPNSPTVRASARATIRGDARLFRRSDRGRRSLSACMVGREGDAPPACRDLPGGVQETWHYKFVFDEPHVAFRAQVEQGVPFQTPSGRIEIFSTSLGQITDWTRTQYGYEIPAIPKWIEPWESLNSPKTEKFPFHVVSPHPRWRTHSIFNNIPWLRETYQQEVTMNASDARRLGLRMGDVVEVYNDRGTCVVPVYVTERCMPGVAVLHEGAWMDLDDKGIDRAGNPDFLTLDEPSPAGAFAYNTVLANIRKTDLEHKPGWDVLATSRSHVFRRDL